MSDWLMKLGIARLSIENRYGDELYDLELASPACRSRQTGNRH